MKRTRAQELEPKPPMMMWQGWGHVLTQRNHDLKERVATLEKQRRQLIKLVNLLLK